MLNIYLNDIYSFLKDFCELPIDVKCLSSTTGFWGLMQALVDNACETSTTTTTPLDLTGIDLCRPGTWDCTTTSFCLVPDICTTLTSEDVVQALVSRVIDLSIQVQTLCQEIEDLKTKDAEIELQIQNLNCCE